MGALDGQQGIPDAAFVAVRSIFRRGCAGWRRLAGCVLLGKRKKIPGAALSGGIAALGRGFCAEVGHFPSARIAAAGG